ncbi:MAG: 4Fe-4S cluster-binding domain-containing protein [Bacteroidota bacterium]|nr:4Fe-4S cluster-binding domain-containing protein [Bacteroidota bacterium]
MQLWKNKHFKNLRKHIRKNNFSYGCLECYHHILNENHNFIYAERYETELKNLSRKYPISLEFQISNKCNFSCVMCNDECSSSICKNQGIPNNTQSGYDSEFPKSLIPLLKHAKRLVFSGGEPFIIKAYDEIIKLSLKYGKNQKFYFSTNGSAINEHQFDFIQKHQVGISMSFDSIDEKTFNLVTGSNRFATVKKNLLRLKTIYEQKTEPLSVKVSPMQQNIHTLAETFTFLNDNNLDITFNHVKYPSNCSLSELKSEQLKNIVTNLKQLDIREETPEQKENKSRYRNFIYYLENTCKKSETREREQINGFDAYEARFISQINNYLKTMNLTEFKNADYILNLMFGHLKNDIVRDECIRYFSELPTHWLISELRFRETNSDYVKKRVNQVANAFHDKLKPCDNK